MLIAAIRVHQKLQLSRKINSDEHLRKINEQCLFGNMEVLGKYEMRKGNMTNGIVVLLQTAHYKGKTMSAIKETLWLVKERVQVELKKIIVSPNA
jgi:hypothetical protein